MSLAFRRFFFIPAIIALLGAGTPVTATGIPLDAPWKSTIYALAQTHFIHPAWGWQHSERNYNLARFLASADGLHVDTDVLFAACFLHDMAAFAPYDAKHKGMEHGDAAALESVAVLRDADSLDFLGSIAIARMIALTGAHAASFGPAIAQLRKFAAEIPPRLITRSGKHIGAERARELSSFLDALSREAGRAM